MSSPYVIGNWKARLSFEESLALARGVAESRPVNQAFVVLCPSYPALPEVGRILAGGSVALGAQDAAAEEPGPYTGAVPAAMLREVGCRYVIVGHSERRRYFAEDDALVARKLQAGLASGLVPILCVGETAEERAADQRDEVLGRQLRGALGGAAASFGGALIVAYEPVWAIGTGVTVSPAEAASSAAAVRRCLAELLGGAADQRHIAVVYGGSVAPENAASFSAANGFDGVLVGTDSVILETFLEIVGALGASS